MGERKDSRTGRDDMPGAGRLTRRDFLRLSGISALTVGGMTLLVGCGPASEGSSDSTSADASSGSSDEATSTSELRVGMEVAYAPYNWQTTEETEYTIPVDGLDGQYADGYDVQIAKVVGKELGREPVAVKLKWEGIIDALLNGQIDVIIAGMAPTEERKQSIDFSDPYFTGTYGLLVRKDGEYASATKLSDFSGASVLGQANTMLDDIIDDIPGVNHLTPADSVPSQLTQINEKRCDAITYNVENTKGLLEANPDLTNVQFEEGDGFQEQVTTNVGVKKGQEDFLEKINAALATLSDDDRQEMFDAAVDRQPK